MSLESPASSTEDEIRRACEAGDLERATVLALEAYGGEVLGWLVQRLRSETDGTDAFAIFTEDLWRGWARFRWQCGVRGWIYVLARNAANRLAVAASGERRRRVGLSEAGAVAELSAAIRTRTLPHLRTTVKDRFRQLREALDEEDQLILVLRVDRRLPWNDIAHVLLEGGDAPPDEAAVRRESARLRKRLQIIKGKLRALGEEAGLI